MKAFTKENPGCHVHLKTDNTTTVAQIVKMGSTKSRSLFKLTTDLWEYCLLWHILIKSWKIQMTSRAALKGFSQAAVLSKPARQHTTKRRTQLLLCHHLSADKLSSGYMITLTPHGCHGWATFAHRHTFRRCFHYSEIAVKIGNSQKVSHLELHASVKSKIVTDVFRPLVNTALKFEMHK